MNRSIVFVFTAILFAGCLKTRAELRGESRDPAPQRITVAQQRAEQARPAPVTAASRFEEYDEQIRQMNGRIEQAENGVAQLGSMRQADAATQARERQALEQKLTAFEDAIRKLEAQVAALTEEVSRLKAPPPPAAPVKGRSHHDEGEELMGAKKYKEAIVAYQKYRDANPKGKLYADATLKIGMAFHELGLKDEAKAFFEEVIAKFPGSKEAKKASARMKSAR